MRKTIYFSFLAFLFSLGCSKSDDLAVNTNENQLKSARTATVINQTNPYLPLAEQTWDNTTELQTSLWPALPVYTAPPGYPVYVASNYDVMAHFQYYSQEAVTVAVVEFTFPQIIDFVPHMLYGRTYTVNNADNITVISCTTDLVAGWNPMFCFIVKVDCSQGNSGYTTFWTDMKVNGVSVKGTIKNKVFACN
jgi:hypothetical protein